MKKNKGWGYGKWTRIDTKMFTSKAFLSLSATSVKVLILFLGKRRLIFPKDRKGVKGIMVCENSNELTMTYKELGNKPFNFTRPRIAVDNTLAETACKLKHQAMKPGRAPCKATQVGSPSEKWRFFLIL